MYKLFVMFFGLLAISSCNTEATKNINTVAIEDNTEINKNSNIFLNEIEKWKKELYLNGEVGPPCGKDYQKWTEENPNYYWGMQKTKTLISDFNADDIKDALVYFPAVNCVGGNGYDSDFSMLVYSYKNQLLTNKNLTKNIQEKIISALADKDIYDVNTTLILFKSFSKTITGKYLAWVEVDAHCCPSYTGEFEYNPIDFSVKITN